MVSDSILIPISNITNKICLCPVDQLETVVSDDHTVKMYPLRLYGQDCTLILTEGDSAKTLAVSGLGVVGRDRYGVFPLKGKLLNVREATSPQVLKNEEIQVSEDVRVRRFGL